MYSFGCLAYEIYTNELAFGDVDHWAELVAVKRIQASPDIRHTIDRLVARTGILGADFVAHAIQGLATSREDRSLSLAGFRNAVDNRAWLRPVRLTGCELELGPFRHGDRFETAHNAAAELRQILDYDDWFGFVKMLRDAYWSRILPYHADDWIARWYLKRGVFEIDHATRSLFVAGSVREAFALGLFDGGITASA